MPATAQAEHKAAYRREQVTVDCADVDSSACAATWTIDFKPRPAGGDGADGRIMGGILGRRLSHDVERAWGLWYGRSLAMPASVSGVTRLGSNQNNAGNIAGTDFGTFFGTFCSQFGTFVPSYSQSRNLAIFGDAVFFIVLRVLVVGAARFELATPSPPD
jgi:hypothetical protein